MSLYGHTHINIDSLKRWVDALSMDGIQNIDIGGYNFEINVNMNVGTVNNGKSAYIFQKNLVTKSFECVKVMPVSEIGNVAFTTTQISDVIVLVQE